jgi:hypothetical protein
MFDDHHVVALPTQGSDHLVCCESLSHIEESRGLIEDVELSITCSSDGDGKPLLLPATEEIDIPCEEMREVQGAAELLGYAPLIVLRKQILHRALAWPHAVGVALALVADDDVIGGDADEEVLEVRATVVPEKSGRG